MAILFGCCVLTPKKTRGDSAAAARAAEWCADSEKKKKKKKKKKILGHTIPFEAKLQTESPFPNFVVSLRTLIISI